VGLRIPAGRLRPVRGWPDCLHADYGAVVMDAVIIPLLAGAITVVLVDMYQLWRDRLIQPETPCGPVKPLPDDVDPNAFWSNPL